MYIDMIEICSSKTIPPCLERPTIIRLLQPCFGGWYFKPGDSKYSEQERQRVRYCTNHEL